jgi:hypothetical protein
MSGRMRHLSDKWDIAGLTGTKSGPSEAQEAHVGQATPTQLPTQSTTQSCVEGDGQDDLETAQTSQKCLTGDRASHRASYRASRHQVGTKRALRRHQVGLPHGSQRHQRAQRPAPHGVASSSCSPQGDIIGTNGTSRGTGKSATNRTNRTSAARKGDAGK